MHWSGFILGLLAGLVVEWLIDLGYWRRRDAGRTESAASREYANIMTPAAARGMVSPTAADPVTASEPEDLVIIEGIGSGIARLLQENGIRTFADLATATPEALKVILASAGVQFRLADPETWPEQAHLAARGDFEALNKLQDRLQAGRARAARSPGVTSTSSPTPCESCDRAESWA